MNETTQDPRFLGVRPGGLTAPVPGLVLVFAGAVPARGVVPLDNGPIKAGRSLVGDLGFLDNALSRQHLRVEFKGGVFCVEDLDSKNGTWVDGERVSGAVKAPPGGILRAGDSIFLLAADIHPHAQHPISVRDELVVGPKLRDALDRLAGTTGRIAHLQGESGSGKELAARAFHARAAGAEAPFVAVNCATIPQSLAERLLFGAKKGAFSGADSDVAGYVEAAHGGTLFLDEVAELELAVQAKLLRVLESGEVLRLGASQPRPVSFALCTATREDLRARVATGKFRDDLYYRIGRPAVSLPPLRERQEEIPWLVELALREVGAPPPTPALIERCLLRPWPGNVRELLSELRVAGRAASMAKDEAVDVTHLPAEAGLPLGAAGSTEAADTRILDALRATGGNVSEAARRLGMHRNQLRRWIERHGSAHGAAETDDEQGA